MASIPFDTSPEFEGYEFTIGDARNTIVNLRIIPANQNLTSPRFGVLSCHTLRQFWVSWYDNVVRMGSGNLNENEFLFYDPQKSVNVRAVSFTTGDIAESAGLFEIPRSTGKFL